MYIDMNSSCLSKNLHASADVIKILGETNRLKIVCLLKKNPLCVCEIFRILKLPQNLVSHHLKILLDADIVSNTRNGKKIVYAINKKTIQNLRKELNTIL